MTYPVVDEGQIDLAHIPRLFPKFPNKEDPGIKISSTSVITSRRRKERRCIKPTKESQTIRTKRDSTSAGGLSLSAANVGRIPGPGSGPGDISARLGLRFKTVCPAKFASYTKSLSADFGLILK